MGKSEKDWTERGIEAREVCILRRRISSENEEVGERAQRR